MRRKWLACRVLLVLLAIWWGCAFNAVAELSRGSRGEDVKALQRMLIDLGFLEDKADGIFGKNTQAAVKALERCLNLPQTGDADDRLVNELEMLWQAVMGEGREMEPPSDAYSDAQPAYCSWTGDEEGTAEYCWRHCGQVPFQQIGFAPNAPEKLRRLCAQRICEIWLRNIEAMYCTWEKEPGKEKIARQQQAIFLDALAENRREWENDLSGGDAILSEMKWLESISVDLCFDLHGAEAQG